MIIALDTHRVLYRNAVLIAYDKANPTTRVDFFDSEINVGNEVYTDENGYLFYSNNGRQPIKCLTVEQDSIIKVSLDGGNNFDIEWYVIDKSFIEPGDVHTLEYRNGSGQRAIWNPLATDGKLPDYLLKTEYRDGMWAESDYITEAGQTSIELDDWVHTLTITADADDTIQIQQRALRAGQTVLIYARKNCNLVINGTTHNITTAHTYMLFNGYGSSTSPAAAQLTDITYTQPPVFVDANRTQENVELTQTSNSQTFAVESPGVLHNSPLFIKLIADDYYADCTIQLPMMDYKGCLEIILDIDTHITGDIALQVFNSNVITKTKTGHNNDTYLYKAVGWRVGAQRHHELIAEN